MLLGLKHLLTVMTMGICGSYYVYLHGCNIKDWCLGAIFLPKSSITVHMFY